MNELSRLRRELISRLLASGILLSGVLELIDTIMFGTPAQAQAALARGELSPGDLKALAKAVVRITNQLQGDLNTSTVLTDMHASICRSEPRKDVLNIGSFIGEHFVKFGMPNAQSGQNLLSLAISGFAETGLAQRWLEGLLLIEQNTQTGWAKVIENLIGAQDTLNIWKMESAANIKLCNSPFSFLSEVVYGTQMLANPTVDASITPQSLLPFTFKTNGAAKVLDGINPDGMLDTFSIVIELDDWHLRPSLPTGGFLQDSAPMISGFINLEITKLLMGTVYTQETTIGQISILSGDQVQSLTRELIGLDFFAEVFPTYSSAYPTQSILKPRIQMQGFARKDDVLANNREFLHQGVLLEGLSLIREEDQLLPLIRDYIIPEDTVVVDAITSYQKREGIKGKMQITETLQTDVQAEYLKVMEYEIIPDEINGGDSYIITTKYYKEANGIYQIGWRYVGYLIE